MGLLYTVQCDLGDIGVHWPVWLQAWTSSGPESTIAAVWTEELVYGRSSAVHNVFYYFPKVTQTSDKP